MLTAAAGSNSDAHALVKSGRALFLEFSHPFRLVVRAVQATETSLQLPTDCKPRTGRHREVLNVYPRRVGFLQDT